MTRFALAASAVISLFTASAVAHAGAVISDQRYWPSEVHRSSIAPRFGFDAMASMGVAPTADPFVYEGGPKTDIPAYRYERKTYRCIENARCIPW